MLNVYILSDSTGDTNEHLADACLKQFNNLTYEIYKFSFIRNIKKLNEIITNIKIDRTIIFSTLATKELKDSLVAFCDLHNIPNIDVVDYTSKIISNYTKIKEYNYGNVSAEFGIQYKIDIDKKRDCIEWTMEHDDGKNLSNLTNSDILILGVSRTSKTPTSVYTSLKSLRISNVPMIYGNTIPQEVISLIGNKFIIGLTISLDRLFKIRRERYSDATGNNYTQINSYTDIEEIKKELVYFLRFYHNNHIPVIDVTNLSVEEISSKIINKYHEWLVKR